MTPLIVHVEAIQARKHIAETFLGWLDRMADTIGKQKTLTEISVTLTRLQSLLEANALSEKEMASCKDELLENLTKILVTAYPEANQQPDFIISSSVAKLLVNSRLHTILDLESDLKTIIDKATEALSIKNIFGTITSLRPKPRLLILLEVEAERIATIKAAYVGSNTTAAHLETQSLALRARADQLKAFASGLTLRTTNPLMAAVTASDDSPLTTMLSPSSEVSALKLRLAELEEFLSTHNVKSAAAGAGGELATGNSSEVPNAQEVVTQALQTRITELEAQLSVAKTAVPPAAATTEAKVAELTALIAVKNDELEAKRELIRQAQVQNQAVIAQLEELNNRLPQAREAEAAAKAQAESAAQAADELRVQLQTSHAAQARLESAKGALQRQIEALQAENDRQQARIIELNDAATTSAQAAATSTACAEGLSINQHVLTENLTSELATLKEKSTASPSV